MEKSGIEPEDAGFGKKDVPIKDLIDNVRQLLTDKEAAPLEAGLRVKSIDDAIKNLNDSLKGIPEEKSRLEKLLTMEQKTEAEFQL